MRLIALTIVALLVAAPSADACSLFYRSFWLGDLDGDNLVTAIGQDAVWIDLATGTQHTIAEDFFPELRAEGGLVFHAGQQGLGADCSGTPYFEVEDASGNVVYERGQVEAHDVDDGLLAVLHGTTVEIIDTVTWETLHTINYPRGDGGTDMFGNPSGLAVSIALDAANQRFAATDAAGELLVITFDEVLVARYDLGADAQPVIAWHGEQLVFGAAEGSAATFTVFTSVPQGDRFTVHLADTGYYAEPHIAAGSMLLVQHADRVVRIDGVDTYELSIPSGHAVGAIAADGNAGVLLVTEEESNGGGSALGIQSLDGDGFGMYRAGMDGAWLPAATPGFAWGAGPPIAMEDGGAPPGPGGDGTDGGDGSSEVTTPAPAALLALGALLLVRRRR